MDAPRLTFFCELDAPSLERFFANSRIIPDLQNLHAAVSLGIIDLTVQRADVIRRLTEANIPVTAWLLLPKDQGYWFNLDNAPAAVERYRNFRDWAAGENLSFACVGLDIEPDLGEMMSFTQKPAETAIKIFRKTLNSRRLRDAHETYQALIAEIHRDGFIVETYQFPVIVDERHIGSTLIQRLLGVLDLHADREVLMLYSSFMGRFGTGILTNYAFSAGGIGIGSTGGGVEIEGALPLAHLTGETLIRDMRLVLDQRKPLYIFSLEGCVQQGILDALKQFDWNQPGLTAPASLSTVNWYRRLFQGFLWISKNAVWLAITGMLLFLLSHKSKKKSRA